MGHAYALDRWGNQQQVIDLLKLTLTYYPNSAETYYRLVPAYGKTKQEKFAASTLKKAVDLAQKYHPELLQSYQVSLRDLQTQLKIIQSGS